MTISEWLRTSTNKLKDSGVATARLDCLILLEDATNKDRAWLLAHPEYELEGPSIKKLNNLVKRRANHEPLAYLRGKSAFYGREFLVNANTLQPRPETETMIELLLEITNKNRQMTNIIDVGTGSGCIAITAKLELPEATVVATDISTECIDVAKRNAEKLRSDVAFHEGNLIETVPRSTFRLPTTICCNLPYVPDSFTINAAAMFEPDIAIFGGSDGLDYFRELFEQLTTKGVRAEGILTESLPTQHDDLAKLAAKYDYQLKQTRDFIQYFAQA